MPDADHLAPDSLPRGLAAPAQARSRRTLERLLAAATRLLDERSFAELTVGEVVAAAGSSVGSFYARFRDKEGLLDTLDEIYAQALMARVGELLAGLDEDPPATLTAAVRHVFTGLVAFHRERRGLIRALMLRARTHREPRYDERTRRMNTLTPELVARLLRHRGEIAHADPARAVELGFAMAYTAMRERMLFPETFRVGRPPGDDELVGEVTRLLVGYLAVPDASGERPS